MEADGARAGVAAPPGAKEPALQLTGLVKRFGETTAVDHIDLVVPRGSFFGLVGPNGAGKTTSLSMAVGLLRPDGGSARIFGVDVHASHGEHQPEVRRIPSGISPAPGVRLVLPAPRSSPWGRSLRPGPPVQCRG